MTDQPLSYSQASELDSLRAILSQLAGWSAAEARRTEHDADHDAATAARLAADRDRYAQLLRDLYRHTPDDVHRLVEELAPVARAVVEGSR
ncbi:hypothetical protein ADK55_31740 [Streptomyces sp. WM4235]|uniref:hypothetical protein n=1 Tax=Streptomyces sp. WM4235 TaxID=1415551 RepID=UPI0006ADE64D|nr:hypothetical protein [Streptomyces sp. WM4235]KOU40451.1 hypothetical protein ADK55_31740 [Streptomyces sp. WM4235]